MMVRKKTKTSLPIAVGFLLLLVRSSLSQDGDAPEINEEDKGEGIMQVYIDSWQESLQEDEQTHQQDPHSPSRETKRLAHRRLEKGDTTKELLAEIDDITNYRHIDDEDETNAQPELDGKKRLQKRSIRVPADKHLWPYGIVPYTLSTTEHNAYEVRRAQLTFERFTCIRFVPWLNASTNQRLGLDSTYLNFIIGSGCGSFIGKLPNKFKGQDISCCDDYACMHEIGHALGLMHEQQSPDPERRRMIGTKFENVQVIHRKHYRDSRTEQNALVGYDILSLMHYKNFGYSNGNGKAFITFYPEFASKIGWNFFYMIKEVSLAYKCAEQNCSKTDITCENEGYLTLVDGECKCMCVKGLDPDTGCSTIIRSHTSSQGFPAGEYALPQPETGCSFPSTSSGVLVHYSEGGNRVSDIFDIKSNISDNRIELSFCVTNITTDTEKVAKWPAGNYCIYRKGQSCPKDFESGYVQFDDKLTNGKVNSRSGSLPDGVFGNNTRFELCCRKHGFADEAIFLPNRKPFVLIKGKTRCQEVRGMHVYEQYYSIKNSKEEGIAGYKEDNSIPVVNKGGNRLEMRFCYYKPAMIDCGEVIELSKSRPTAQITSPNGPELECTWFIKAPEGENVILRFDEFNLTTENCEQDLEIRYLRPGQEGFKFSGGNMNRTFQSVYNTIVLTLSTCSFGTARFSAKASLQLKANLCYNSKDRGMSYAGTVNVTRFYQNCVPWEKATKCKYNPFSINFRTTYLLDRNTLLKENYCRNPDMVTGDLPWCYTDAETCERNYCDPCQLGSVYDRQGSDHCTKMKRHGFCDQEELLSACALTCGSTEPDSNDVPGKASEVICPYPPQVDDGSIIHEKNQGRYLVGDKVTYKCNTSSATRERVCLTSGAWSPMGFVCDVCQDGWHYEASTDSCYQLSKQVLNFPDAMAFCKREGGYMVRPRTEKIRTFIKHLISERLWLPMENNSNKIWIWDDEIQVDWTGWERAIIDFPDYEKCAFMEPYSGVWRASNCGWKHQFMCVKRKEEIHTCKDFWDECSRLYKANVEMCQKYQEFAIRFCPFTCGLCDADSTPRCSVDSGPVDGSTFPAVGSTIHRGAVVYSVCHEGYVALSGHAFRGCLKNGELTGTPLICAKTCPVGWVYSTYSRNCYRLINESTDYVTASRKCKEMGGFLAMPKTPKEKQVFFSVANNTDGFIWVGITDKVVEGLHIWDDGRVSIYKSPSYYSLGDCGRMNPKNGEWKSEMGNCDDEWQFVCQVPLAQTAPQCQVEAPATNVESDTTAKTVLFNEVVTYTCSHEGQVVHQGDKFRKCLVNGGLSGGTLICGLPCPEGWVFFNYHCYNYFNEAKNYNDAQSVCDGFGSTLVMPKTRKLNKNIKGMRKSTSKRMFIGLNYTKPNYIWADGQELHGWSVFAYGSYDDKWDQWICLVMEPNGKWQRVGCWAKFRFMCETPYSDMVKAIQPCNVKITSNMTSNTTKDTVSFNEIVTYTCQEGNIVHQGDAERKCSLNGVLIGKPVTCGLPCPVGWVFSKYKCYKYFNEAKNYNDAQSVCNDFGSTLVMPKTQELNEDVKSLRNLTKEMIFIGLNITNLNYIWADGQKLHGWSFFESGSYDAILDQFLVKAKHKILDQSICIVMDTNGKWQRVGCLERFRFMCETPYYDMVKAIKPCNVKTASNMIANTTKETVSFNEIVTYRCSEEGKIVLQGDNERKCSLNGVLIGKPVTCGLPCPGGWVFSKYKCYKYFKESKSYDDAQSVCDGFGSTLVMPKSQELNEYIKSLRTSTKKSMFIGLNFTSPNYTWADGQVLQGWKTFARNYSDYRKRSRCVIMKRNGKWRRTDCSKKYRFMCEAPYSDMLKVSKPCNVELAPNVISNTTKKTVLFNEVVTYRCSEEGKIVHHGDTVRTCLANGVLRGKALTCGLPCPDGWVFSKYKCYKFFNEAKNYYDAESVCNGFVSTLVMPRTQVLNEDVKSLRNSTKKTMFIGLNYTKPNYTWADGQELKGWKIFARNYSDQDQSGCVIMKRNGKWRRTKCSKKYRFMCEAPYPDMLKAIKPCNSKLAPNVIANTTKETVLFNEVVAYRCKEEGKIVHQGDTVRKCLTHGVLTGKSLTCGLPCPEGWVFSKYKCYKYFNEAKNYNDAQSVCNVFSSTLVMPKTPKLNKYVKSLRNSTTTRMFIGLNYTKPNYIWADGQELRGWSIFQYGSYDDKWDQWICLVMEPNGKWQRVGCWAKFRFMCETPYSDMRKAIQPCHVEAASSNVLLETSENKVDFNHFVRYSCKEGFVISEGDTSRKCLANGKLSGKTLLCAKPNM